MDNLGSKSPVGLLIVLYYLGYIDKAKSCYLALLEYSSIVAIYQPVDGFFISGFNIQHRSRFYIEDRFRYRNQLNVNVV